VSPTCTLAVVRADYGWNTSWLDVPVNEQFTEYYVPAGPHRVPETKPVVLEGSCSSNETGPAQTCTYEGYSPPLSYTLLHRLLPAEDNTQQKRVYSYHTRGHLGQARANTNALQSVVDGWLAEACIMLLLLLTFALANFGTATSR